MPAAGDERYLVCAAVAAAVEQKRKDAYSSCILWRLHLTVDPVLRQTTCPFCMKNASFAVESMDTPTGFLLQSTEMGWIKMFART